MAQAAGISLHEQVRNTLLFEIESGGFPDDGRLPSETELCERFNVSRITVRRAVADLEAMGMLTRRQGKGTFATPPRSTIGTMAMGGFSDHMSGGGEMSRRIIRATTSAADSEMAVRLGVEVGSPILRLLRVFLLDGTPLSLDDSTYSLERYPGFDARVDDGISTYRILREEYDVHFHEVERTIGVAFTTEESAALLERPEHDALIVIDKIARDRNDDVIHISRVEAVPSRLELRMTAREDD